MEVSEFQRILHLGLGRVILFLQHNDPTPYRDVILDACLHNTSYDPQFEGSKEVYLYEIIPLVGDSEFFRDRVIARLLETSSEYDWDTSALFDLLAQYGQHGDQAAAGAVREKFEDNLSKGHDTGFWSYVKLDGVPAFLSILRRCGTPGFPIDGYDEFEPVLFELEERYGRWDVRQAFKRAYVEDESLKLPLIAVYRARRKSKPAGKRNVVSRQTLSRMDYQSLKSSILPVHDKYYWSDFIKWGRMASDADLMLAASDLLAEDDPDRLFKYVSIFGERTFPLDPERLMVLAQRPSINFDRDFKLAVAAMNALENVSNPVVRAFAFQLIAENNKPGMAVGLLQHNFQDGDWQRIEKLTQEPLSREDWHRLGFSVSELYERYPSEEVSRIFINLYEHDPCSYCRERFVDKLHSMNKLPDWMLEECKLDCNPRLRAKARRGFVEVKDNAQK